MFPFIKHGDTIIVKSLDIDKLRCGDILLFRQNSTLTCHRFFRKQLINNKVMLLTQGDFLPQPDLPVDSKNIIGKAIAVERNRRIINLERGFNLWINRLIGLAEYSKLHISYLTRFVSKIFHFFTRNLRANKYFRSFYKKLLKNKIHYSRANKKDYPETVKFYSLLDRSALPMSNSLYKKLISKDNTIYFIAKNKNKIVGALALVNSKRDETGAKWWIFGLYVNRWYRGGGIGEKLTRMAVDYAAEKKVVLFALVLSQNVPSLKLGEKLGFKPVKQIPKKGVYLKYQPN